MKTYDYTNKIIYIGIDVHKKTYSCVSICEGTVVKRDTMPADPALFLRYLKNTFTNSSSINTAYEAGFSGFHLHRYLITNGITNIVVHPGSIEVASRNRVKTDKRDALKIATQLEAGRLQSVFIPSVEQEEKRSVTRLRIKIVKLKHQVGYQLKALLFTQGLIDMDDDTILCQSWIAKKLIEVEAGNYSKHFLYTLNQYIEQWFQLNARVKEIDKMIKRQSNEERGLQDIYESVPGVGPLLARILANELGDMKQFPNEKRLFSFTGLTPSEHSSGEHTRQGHITRQGNPILRGILVEAAWVAIRRDPGLEEIFKRMAATRGKRRAIVGIARRLAGRIRSCVLAGELYQTGATTINHLSQEESVCATSS
ncbi:MAG TPA: IS110 family transposase [Waddliaceae bacterium]|jgi:transposase